MDLIEDAVLAERAKPDTVHADGGPSMTSTVVKQLSGRSGDRALTIAAARVE